MHERALEKKSNMIIMRPYHGLQAFFAGDLPHHPSKQVLVRMYEENLLFQDEIPDAICMLPAKIALVSDYTQLLMKLLAA